MPRPLTPVLPFDSMAIRPSDYIDARVLATTTHESHTVPASAKYVRITTNLILYIKLGGTAAIPAADVTDGSGSLMISAGDRVIVDLAGATAIGMIAPAATIVCLEFFE